MDDVKPTIRQPVPSLESQDEILSITDKNLNIWAIKVPRVLLDRWEQVKEAGVELATMRIEHDFAPPRITLVLPKTGLAAVSGDQLDEYDLDIQFDEKEQAHTRAKNTFVFTEKERSGRWGATSGSGNRPREKAYPNLLGRVAHEATLRPVRNEKYKKLLARRTIESGQARRPIQKIEDLNMSLADKNKLAGGWTNANSRLGRNMVALSKSKSVGDKRARMERTELTDRIFELFTDKPYWTITALRNELQQPEQWLRQVLAEYAETVQSGAYVNMWRLKPEWQQEWQESREKGKKIDFDAKPEPDADEEEEDDEDEDMEEVDV